MALDFIMTCLYYQSALCIALVLVECKKTVQLRCPSSTHKAVRLRDAVPSAVVSILKETHERYDFMNILTVYNRSNAESVSAMMQISAYLASQDIDHDAVDALDLVGTCSEDLDMVIVLGGDGTVLSTAAYVEYARVPILGLNYGHLGFIVNKCEDDVVSAVAGALAGEVTTEYRSNLHIDVRCEDDGDAAFERRVSDYVSPDNVRTFFALNEAALTHGSSGRVVDLRLDVNGTMMGEINGDGLVVATATGSTAYALSAGGPMIAPDFTGIEAVPLAPHSLRSRALVTGSNDVVGVDVMKSPAAEEATLFCDGRESQCGSPISRIVVRRGEQPTVLLRRPGNDFYARVHDAFA